MLLTCCKSDGNTISRLRTSSIIINSFTRVGAGIARAESVEGHFPVWDATEDVVVFDERESSDAVLCCRAFQHYFLAKHKARVVDR